MSWTEDERKQFMALAGAIVKIYQILEDDKEFKTVVLGDIKGRLKALELKDDDFQREVNNSCNLKSKEIDNKVKISKYETSDFIKDARRECRILIGLIGSACMGTLLTAYMSLDAKIVDVDTANVVSHTKLSSTMNTYHNETVRNDNTLTTHVIPVLSKISDKLDEIIKHDHKRGK